MNQIKLKDHLSVREFAEVVGVSRWAVWKQIHKGRIHTVNIGMTWIHKNQLSVYRKIQKGRL